MSHSIANVVPNSIANIAWRKLLLRITLVAGVAVLAWFAITCIRIVRLGDTNEARKADAIVVFGAAEYAGRPSPVLRARLDHAYALYRQGLAPVVITSGGAAWDPKFTEGGVGRDYLAKLGVPDRALIAETYAENTAESAERVAVILRANGMNSCIAVSDPTHVFRIKKMLSALGVEAYVSPRQRLPQRWYNNAAVVMREAVAYMAWRAGMSSLWLQGR
jgi:uncharacterized SAM-binding protein YcdF (DUF218 family)